MSTAVTDDDVTHELLKLDNQFCFALYAASRRVVRAYRPLLEALDLTYPQYLVLLVLWGWEREPPPGRPTVQALGERLELDSGTLTPLLRRLEAKGLIERTRADRDERELAVRLTPCGSELKQRAREVPLRMLSSSPWPTEELLAMRDKLKTLQHADPM